MSPFATAPLVSVIIPTRNRRELLLRAVRSVERQTLRDWELIVVDDASDLDMAPVAPFLDAAGARVLRNPQRLGGAISRNRGVAAARGRYVAFLDSDDYWLPAKLERQVTIAAALGEARYLLASGLWFLRGGTVLPFTQPTLAPGESVARFLYVRGGVLQTSTLFAPTAVVRQFGFDERLPVHQDTDLLLRLEAAGIPIHLHPEPLALMDATPRESRITLDPSVLLASEGWYRAHAEAWSPAVRRGFLRHDRALRLARSGRRLAALAALLGGLEMPPSPRQVLRDAIAILMGDGAVDNLRTRLRHAPPPAPPELGREVALFRDDDAWAHAALAAP